MYSFRKFVVVLLFLDRSHLKQCAKCYKMRCRTPKNQVMPTRTRRLKFRKWGESRVYGVGPDYRKWRQSGSFHTCAHLEKAFWIYQFPFIMIFYVDDEIGNMLIKSYLSVSLFFSLQRWVVLDDYPLFVQAVPDEHTLDAEDCSKI